MNPMINSVKMQESRPLVSYVNKSFLNSGRNVWASLKKVPKSKTTMVQKSGSPVEVGTLPQYLQGYFTSQVVIARFLNHQQYHCFEGQRGVRVHLRYENDLFQMKVCWVDPRPILGEWISSNLAIQIYISNKCILRFLTQGQLTSDKLT